MVSAGGGSAAASRPAAPPHPVELAGLLHELTAQMLAAPDVQNALERIAELAADALPEAVRCSVVLIGDGTPTVTAARGEQARALDDLQHATGQGPALDALRTRSVVTCRDLTSDQRWPAIVDCARRSQVEAVASVPMDVRRNAVGALTVFVARPDGIDTPVMITAMALAGQAEILLGEVLRRQIEADTAGQLVATRLAGATVDQAVGVIVAQRGCGVEEAYEILRETSERLHTHPQDVAERLVQAAVRHAE